MLTMLPGRCCVHAGYTHAQGDNGKSRSLTVAELLFQEVLDLDDDASNSNADTDCFCDVYCEAYKQADTHTTTLFSIAPVKPVVDAPVVAVLNYTGYNTRQFSLPPHYNYLFRLTPF